MKYVVIQGCRSMEPNELLCERCIGICDTYEQAIGKAYLTMNKVRSDEIDIIDHNSEDEVGNIEGPNDIAGNDDDGVIFTLKNKDSEGSECLDYVKILYYFENQEE